MAVFVIPMDEIYDHYSCHRRRSYCSAVQGVMRTHAHMNVKIPELNWNFLKRRRHKGGFPAKNGRLLRSYLVGNVPLWIFKEVPLQERLSPLESRIICIAEVESDIKRLLLLGGWCVSRALKPRVDETVNQLQKLLGAIILRTLPRQTASIHPPSH